MAFQVGKGGIVEWNDKDFLGKLANVLEMATKNGAEIVAEKARNILTGQGADELSGQIAVEPSQYRDGGFIVIAQGKWNYDRFYASFRELGHYSSVYGKYKRPKAGMGSLKGISPVHIEKKPYLRPALARSKKAISAQFDKNTL